MKHPISVSTKPAAGHLGPDISDGTDSAAVSFGARAGRGGSLNTRARRKRGLTEDNIKIIFDRAGKAMFVDSTAISSARREGVNLIEVAGVADAWTVSVSLWHGPIGFDSSTSPDNKPHHTVAVRLKGSLVQRVRSCRSPIEELAPDGFSIHPAGRDLRFLATSEIRFAHLHLDDDYLRTVSRDINDVNSEGAEFFQDDRVMFRDDALRHQIFDYVARAFDHEDPAGKLEMDSRAVLISISLLKRHSTVGQWKRGREFSGGLAPWQVRAACDFMSANLGEDVSLAAVAKLVGISQEHFCRAFRKTIGVPPYRWLKKTRINQAQILLLERSLSLTEIAQQLGYTGQSAFGVAFRKETGVTPSQFRRII